MAIFHIAMFAPTRCRPGNGANVKSDSQRY
jgi:hypothetical protein